ncbi:glycosyl hydrolase [Noviherbaspirillum sedimenti]|uniref:Glycosyl hydrolase n=2 Tax=Noviherbaspirillum sedimenti TaxID=2320865 RepID=A0A3A3G8S7_9BURK|nr:glycosyl hydrolase [Noviherbaspirillum sedimenti]
MSRALLLTGAALAIGALALPPAHAAAFQDPLNVPARISPLAATSMLTAITHAGDRLVAVGPHGRILLSDDQGKKWTQVPVPTSVDLVAAHFPTEKKGWAVGHGGIVLHTEDGGQTWRKQLDGAQAGAAMLKYYESPVRGADARTQAALTAAKQFAQDGTIHPFLDVWFENEQVGYIVGPFNMILRTADGGTSWTPWLERTDNPKDMNFNAIRGSGSDVYIVGEQGLILKLDREKQHFSALKSPYEGSFFGLIPTPQSLVVFGMRGSIYRSADGGASWQKAESGDRAGLTSGTVLKDGQLAIVSMSGSLLVSADGGAHFSPVPVKRTAPLFGVAPAGARGVGVVGIAGAGFETLKQ